MPHNLLSVARRDIEEKKEDEKTEQANSTIFATVVCALLAGESADQNDGNSQSSTERNSHLFRDHGREPHASVVPDKMHRLGHNGDWDVEEQESEHDGEPQQKRNHPVLVMAVLDDTGKPPTGQSQSGALLGYCGLPYPVMSFAMKMWTSILPHRLQNTMTWKKSPNRSFKASSRASLSSDCGLSLSRLPFSAS